MHRSAEEQVLGVGPLDAALNEETSTRLFGVLTLVLLLTLLAMTAIRGAQLRAVDLVSHTYEVELAIAHARIAVDEQDPKRGRELFEEIADLTTDNQRQHTRADTLLHESDVRAIRTQLNVMATEENALLAVRQADAQSKRSAVRVLLLLVVAIAVLFSASSIYFVRKGRRDLGKQTAMLGSILDSIGDSIVAVDRQGRCVIVNAAFRRTFSVGFGHGKVGINDALRHGLRRVDGTTLEFDDGPFGLALRGEAVDNFAVSLYSDPKGPRVWLSATSRPVRNARREIETAVAVLRDVTRERNDRELLAMQAAELQWQSLSDELTGLYNRRGFTLLSNQYARTAVRSKRPFAVLFCDLNGLKTINDTHGHEAGDDAIARMAEVLKATFRESDIVARLGGDEYVALVDGADEATIATVINRLNHEMDLDAERHNTPYRLHTSTGAAFQPAGGTATIDALLTIADERMYSEKKVSKHSREAKTREAEEREHAAREAAIREAKLKEAKARLAQAQAAAAGEVVKPPPPSVRTAPRPRSRTGG